MALGDTLELNCEEINQRVSMIDQLREKAEELYPYLEQWGICYAEPWRDSRKWIEVEEGINAFFEDATQKEFDAGYNPAVILEGYVYGHPRFANGDPITTSPIRKLERIGNRVIAEPDRFVPIAGDAFKATTCSGSEYYFTAGWSCPQKKASPWYWPFDPVATG